MEKGAFFRVENRTSNFALWTQGTHNPAECGKSK